MKLHEFRIRETFEGKKMLAIHTSNKSPKEHATFIKLDKYV